jgi:hypothetical protein
VTQRQVEEISILSLFKSAFRLKVVDDSDSLNFKYRKPDIVHDNYSDIFESMKAADEKNRRVTKRFHLVDQPKIAAADSNKQPDQLKKRQQSHHIKIILVQVTVLVFFTFTNIYFVFDSFKKCY